MFENIIDETFYCKHFSTVSSSVSHIFFIDKKTKHENFKMLSR